jgi:heterodisulfide reductase subunit C
MEKTFQSVNELADTNVENCYQCGKCTAGCPMGEVMDNGPTKLIRLVQLGLEEKALLSDSIWQCVSCQTCTARCPKSVNCAGVMDALRQLSVERSKESPKQQRTILFQKAFLQNIKRNGRLNEVELIASFKTRAFMKDLSVPMLMKDTLLAPKLMKRGKFHLIGEKAKDRDVVGRIFKRCMDSDN